MKIFNNNFFRKNSNNIDDFLEILKQESEEEKRKEEIKKRKELKELDELKNINFNTNELIEISNVSLLDTTSLVAIKKFHHNLEILINQAKKQGKVNQFMIIRDDDFLPDNWHWEVNSCNTHLEKIAFRLSIELRHQYELEKQGKDFSKVNPELGQVNVLIPFRSTKHFTVNTPLELTGDYNLVKSNRNYTIIDSMDSFFSSGYAYSLSYHDAYLDVSHESLPISKNAIVLIEESKYHKLSQDSTILNQLKNRKLVIYKGKESDAINMILSENGVLPARIESTTIHYDKELCAILNHSIQDLAKKYQVNYDKSHGGKEGHFTSYLDDKNFDYQQSISRFVEFLCQKFPEYSSWITLSSIQDEYYSYELVKKIGVIRLKNAIDEYNETLETEFLKRKNEYRKNRKTITSEISFYFKNTVQCIKQYYELGWFNQYSLENQRQIEKNIIHFFQDNTVQEQIMAAEQIWNILNSSMGLDIDDEKNKDKTSSILK